MNDKDYFIEKLREIADREKRLPKKADFTTDEVNRIKGLFGPWPWALEQAGLKEPKIEKRLESNREKRRKSRDNRRND